MSEWTKEHRETWAEWLPSDAKLPPESTWITREELLEALALDGVIVSERSMKRWETNGDLPRPVRRWRDNARYAFYPPFHTAFVKALVAGKLDDRPRRHDYLAYATAHGMDEVLNRIEAGIWFFGSQETMDHAQALLDKFAGDRGETPAAMVISFVNDDGKTLQRLIYQPDEDNPKPK